MPSNETPTREAVAAWLRNQVDLSKSALATYRRWDESATRYAAIEKATHELTLARAALALVEVTGETTARYELRTNDGHVRLNTSERGGTWRGAFDVAHPADAPHRVIEIQETIIRTERDVTDAT